MECYKGPRLKRAAANAWSACALPFPSICPITRGCGSRMPVSVRVVRNHRSSVPGIEEWIAEQRTAKMALVLAVQGSLTACVERRGAPASSGKTWLRAFFIVAAISLVPSVGRGANPVFRLDCGTCGSTASDTAYF